MKIILNKKIDKLGDAGQIINVKDGYARNFLIPNGWAKLANKKNILATQKLISINEKKEAKTRENLEALSKQLNKLTLKFELKSGDDGKLFGSVTSQMISDEIEKKGYKINKKEIDLSEPIKHVGKYFIEIKLGNNFNSKVKLKITSIEKK